MIKRIIDMFILWLFKTLIKHPDSHHAISLHDEVYKEAFDALSKLNQIFNNEFVVTRPQRPSDPELLDRLRLLEVSLNLLNEWIRLNMMINI